MYIKNITYQLTRYAELNGGLAGFDEKTKIKNTMDKITLTEMIISDYLDQAVRSQLYGIKHGDELQYYIRTDYGIYELRPDTSFFSPASDYLHPITMTPFDWAARNVMSSVKNGVITPSDYPDEENMREILWSEIGRTFDSGYAQGTLDTPKAKDVLLSLQRR